MFIAKSYHSFSTKRFGKYIFTFKQERYEFGHKASRSGVVAYWFLSGVRGL